MFDKMVTSIENSSAMIISAIVVTAVSFIMYRLIKRALNLMAKKGKLAVPMISTLSVLLRWTFVIVTALLVLQQIGLLQNVWAALLAVVATIAIGFVAEWSILSNVFSTLLVLIYRPFTIGDTVEVLENAVKGEVIDINFMFTSLKDKDNRIVQVPNKTFFCKTIVKNPGSQDISLYEQLKSDKPYGE